MASVFKREGAGRSNRWYAQIKIGRTWKVIRLPAVYAGEGAIKKDKALHLALETELMANKAVAIDVGESTVQEFTRKVIQLTKEDVMSENTSEYLRRWIAGSEEKVVMKKLAEGSHRARKAVVKIYLDYIGREGSQPLAVMFTYAKMKIFLSDMEKAGKAKATVKIYAATLSTIAKDAIKEGKLFKNPLSDQEIGGKATEVRTVFNQDEADRIMHCPDEAVRRAFSLMLCTGMRVGDALSLTWGNVDLDKRLLRFTPEKQKTGAKKELVVPICGKLVRILSAIENKQGSIVGEVRGRSFYHRFEKTRDLLKITKEITPHSARHYFISLLANAKVPEEFRMKLVGHAANKSKIHAVYTHLNVESIREELDKVEWLN